MPQLETVAALALACALGTGGFLFISRGSDSKGASDAVGWGVTVGLASPVAVLIALVLSPSVATAVMAFLTATLPATLIVLLRVRRDGGETVGE